MGPCVGAGGHNVEVAGSHVGLAFNCKAYHAIAKALALDELPSLARAVSGGTMRRAT